LRLDASGSDDNSGFKCLIATIPQTTALLRSALLSLDQTPDCAGFNVATIAFASTKAFGNDSKLC
jgi:hypothetical protein